MASIDEVTLKKIVAVMKQEGVLEFQSDGLSVKLDPSRCHPAEEAPAPRPVVKEHHTGKDGLTADQQADLYGYPMGDTQE